MQSFLSSFSRSPDSIIKFLDNDLSKEGQTREDQLNSLTAATYSVRKGDVSITISPSDENELLKRFKNHGYQDGLEKKPMNQNVLNSFSLTTDYRYADAYGKGYKAGKEKAFRQTSYGGKTKRRSIHKTRRVKKTRGRK
jgi:hypothetical protein